MGRINKAPANLAQRLYKLIPYVYCKENLLFLILIIIVQDGTHRHWMNRLFLYWCHTQKVLDHHLKCESRNENWHSHHAHSHLVLNGTLNTKNKEENGKKKCMWFGVPNGECSMPNANVVFYVKWMFIKFHLLVNLTLSHRNGWHFVWDFIK